MREKGLFRKPLTVAMDWHDEMYYGDIDAYGVIGTKNKAGTNYAYEYATASIVVKGIRFVIAGQKNRFECKVLAPGISKVERFLYGLHKIYVIRCSMGSVGHVSYL